MEIPARRQNCGRGCEKPTPHDLSLKQYPPGMGFLPHDHELIDYLRRKLSGEPLRQPHPIMDLNVYKHTPQQLSELNGWGDREGVWYFFTTRDRKHKNGTRPNREAAGGFWKATGSAGEIVHDGQVIGWKRSLVYYLGKPQSGVKTGWIMHEFTAKDSGHNNNNNRKRTIGENDMQLDGYVLCKIHMNRRKYESKDQRKRKSAALTKDECKAPHKDLSHRDFHAESLSPVPGPNGGAPLEPWGQAHIAELPSLCDGVPTPEQMQQQLQGTEKGTIYFQRADTPNHPVISAQLPLDMFDLWETQVQQQTANHGAINQSHPKVPIDSVAGPPHMPFISMNHGQPETANDRAAAVNLHATNNASYDWTGHGANASRDLSLARQDSSSFPADFDDDLVHSNESSLWRFFDYSKFCLRLQ